MADSAALGGAGFDLTSLRFRKAGKQLLHPASREEVGIDGVLELRDENKRAYGALLLVQIKALGEVDATAVKLRYVVKPNDAAYTDLQPLPFLLVVADPEGTEQVWWKCLQDAWSDPARRATRAVDFDVERDCLRPSSASALRAAFERHRPRHDRATRPVLDIYVAMISRWRPGRAWLAEHCPKAMASIEVTERDPVVASVWARNFPES